MYTRICGLLEQGKTEEALDVLETIPTESWRSHSFLKCQALCAVKEFDKAIKLLDALEDERFDADVYFRRGEVFSLWKQQLQAYENLTTYLNYEPESVAGLVNRGYLSHYYLQRFEEAKQDFLKAKSLEHDAVVCLNLGTLFRDAFKQYDVSLMEFDESLRITPTSNAYAQKGLLMFFMGKVDEALSLCEEAIRLNAKYGFSYYVKAVVYESQQKWSEAIENYQKMLEVGYHLEQYVEEAQCKLKLLKVEHCPKKQKV